MTLPDTPSELLTLNWPDFAPIFQDLLDRPLDSDSLLPWLADWSRVAEAVNEMQVRLMIAASADTSDQGAQLRYDRFLDEIFPRAAEMEQGLKQKLIASGQEPEGFAVPLRNMRSDAGLYRDANLPLLSQEQKIAREYGKINGAQTVEWQGQELTLAQLRPAWQNPDRAVREQAWRLTLARQLADRAAIDDLWVRLFKLRQKIAANAGKPDYRAYIWQDYHRFDYTPEDSLRFLDAIEAEIVPAVARIFERRRARLGVDTLRPWDLEVDPSGRAPLKPYGETGELTAKIAAIFYHVNPQLGEYFDIMRRENLLDLENRKNKAPGGFCEAFARSRKPFIYMNAVGLHDDVQTLLHESGHAFHVFETRCLPYYHQLHVGMEFAEVASMSMEFLGAPYFSGHADSFYSPQDAARARLETLERAIAFWPYMAVVDGFQQWAYTHPRDAVDPAACSAEWAQLYRRFHPTLDFSGLEDALSAGWQHKLHIFEVPFYYVEYGLAQLGAVQVWRNAIQDQAGAVAAYRKALALGGTASLPELYRAAGARFAFDRQTLSEAAGLIETTLTDLEQVAGS